jgi:hypothetical protein
LVVVGWLGLAPGGGGIGGKDIGLPKLGYFSKFTEKLTHKQLD